MNNKKTENQIKELMDQKFVEGLKVRIMADCHAGAGCVIGTTMEVRASSKTNVLSPDTSTLEAVKDTDGTYYLMILGDGGGGE